MFSCAKKIRFEAVQKDVEPITTIESIVEEALLELFSFLDAESLKNAALVCKTWDRLIGSSAVTMKKLVLRIEEKDGVEIEFDYDFISTRRHQNVKLISRKDGVGILDNFDVSHAKTFEISLHGSTAPIWPILSAMTMLKCLTIFEFKFHGDAQQVNLPNLRQLTVNYESEDSFQYVRADNLEIFDCMSIEDPHKAVEFLKSCEKLKRLSLHLFVLNMLLDFEDMFSMKFQLTKLTIWCHARQRDINANSCSKFLISQAGSLSTINMFTYQFSDDWKKLYKTLFKLTKLTNLHIRNTNFADTFSQCIDVNPLRSLKEFSSLMPHLSADRFELLMKRLPKLETFTFYFQSSEALSDDFINVIGRQPMLKRVKFLGSRDMLAKIFDKIKTNYGRLKIILFVFNGEDKTRFIRFIRFDLPEDSSQWNLKEQEEKFQFVKEQRSNGEQSSAERRRVWRECNL